MCGIVGTLGFQPAPDRGARALAAIRNRGPDGEGQWRSDTPRAWLGHRRLAIIDLAPTGAQPMVHPERPDLVITFNGEIYNYRSLRAELQGRGHRFRSTSDTEVLLHAYVAWGEGMLDRIEGMFAFALVDGPARRAILARDPVGQKPLYVATVDEGMAFGSTPDAVLELMPAERRLSGDALCYVLTLGYVPAPHAIWSGVESLRPGEVLVWREGEPVRRRRYWKPPDSVTRGATDVPAFGELFQTVCGEHTVADVPVGLFLSGGLDSTSVACALREARTPVECFTLGFPGSRRSEDAVAMATAKHLGFAGRTLHLRAASVDDLRHRVAASAPEPQGYSSLLPMYAIAELAAAERMKVMISGDGGDEVFGGYDWYARPGGGVRRGIVALLRSLRGGHDPVVASDHDVERFARRSPLHRHAMRVFHRFLPAEAATLFAPLGSRFSEDAMLEPLREHYVSSLPHQHAMQRVDLMTFCSGSVLAKVDRMAMAHSLEVRAPFLDRRLVDWSLSRSQPVAARGAQKPVLRRYLRGRAPDEVLRQKKLGFGMRGMRQYDYRPLVNEIAQSQLVESGILRPDFGRFVDPGSSSGKARLWTLASVASWYDRHARPAQPG